MRERSEKPKVAIIGMSGVFPKARDLREYWENIIHKIDCITDVPESRWKIDEYYDPDPRTPDKTYCKRGGFIPDIEFDPVEFGMPPNILEVTDVAQLLTLVVAKQALKDAGYENANESIRERTGVILGIGGGQKLITPLTSRLQYPIWEKVLKSSGLSDENTREIIEKIKLAYIPWEENSFPGMLGNVIAGRVANRLDLGGINCAVDAACASSLSALRMALSELVEYRSDMMLVGGVDTDNTIFMYMCFSKTPAFSLQGQIRPFDISADGMLIGEGLGILVLKRLEDAIADNDRIYAVIRGIGSSSDGKYKSIYAPRSSGQAVALRRAYQEAGFPPDTIGLLEAHGTGTIAGDRAEFEGLREVFGTSKFKKQSIALGSIKSQIGHTKSAAGIASIIKVALSLYHKILPPTLNVERPNPKFNFEESPFYLNTRTRPWLSTDDRIPRRAGVSSFGFGGTNFHAVLEEYEKDHDQPYRLHPTFPIILISAPTPQKLLNECRELENRLQSDSSLETYQELIEERRIPTLSARLGFVAGSIAEALELLQISMSYLEKHLIDLDSWQHPRKIYYRKTGINPKGKVVALFGGQGSQYLEMGKELALNFPPARQAYRLMDSVEIENSSDPISEIVFPGITFDKTLEEERRTRLNQTENAQPAIGAFNMGLYKILQQAGFKPDFVAGHSLGELSALWAAGVLSDRDYCYLVKSRGRAMASPDFDAGKMLAVIGDIKQVENIVSETEGISITNYNSREQIVIAGKTLQLLQLKEKLKSLSFKVTLLPVSAAFHTPLVDYALPSFKKAIQEVTFHLPKIPIFSNTTANLYPSEPEKIQEILLLHFVSSVNFKEQIENIYNAGGYFFIECGPKNILTNFVSSILKDKPHIVVALDHKNKTDLSQKNSINARHLGEAIVQLRVSGLHLNNIDTYFKEKEFNNSESKSKLSITLNGANYVSEKTQKTFENALQNENSKPT